MSASTCVPGDKRVPLHLVIRGRWLRGIVHARIVVEVASALRAGSAGAFGELSLMR
jgi:hypothetical protein